jgi:Ca-activated chloride channel family protein
MRRWATLAACAVLAGLPQVARAEPWSLLRSENRNVRAGNEKLAANDAAGALEAYDVAARQLPSEGGVHLNRGIALLASKKPTEAREALKLAVQSKADPATRADAHYDLGLSFYQEADAAAGKDDHEGAQQLFREAAESFKQSLRLRPGNRDAAWNYELARRRIREQEEKQKQKEQQEKQDEQKQDQEQDQQQQDQQQDQQKQDQEQQDQQQDQQKQDEQKQDQQQQDQQQQDQQQQDAQPEPQEARPRSDAERALDALQDGEENLERLKAARRAARERRAPAKDW